MTREARLELVSLSHDFYRRGWCLATSGNFSARTDPQHFIITASGKDKGTLQENDFVELDLQGHYEKSAQSHPSAETLLHATVYKEIAEVNCVLHTHSVFSNVLSMKYFNEGRLLLQNYEMLKALEGVYTHQHTEMLRILPNSQDMVALSEKIADLVHDEPEPHGFLIEAHGLYTWGKSISEARRQLEALEFLLECEHRRVK
jgi:methylthioribulose-1-phosphate dehydratase